MPDPVEALSPGFRALLDENRELRDQLSDLRCEMAGLVGRYDKVGSVPVEQIDALLERRR